VIPVRIQREAGESPEPHDGGSLGGVRDGVEGVVAPVFTPEQGKGFHRREGAGRIKGGGGRSHTRPLPGDG